MRQRGDTMIEVLFAVTIFSMVAVGALTIMNKSAAAAQRSLELTMVRHEIDTQAETLRVLYDDVMRQKSANRSATSPQVANWNAVLAQRKAQVTSWDAMRSADGQSCVDPTGIDDAFVMNVNTGSPVPYIAPVGKTSPPLYSRVLYRENTTIIDSAEGLWIEAERHNADTTTNTPGYTDFHIRACWYTIGQSAPATIGTIVRLYEP